MKNPAAIVKGKRQERLWREAKASVASSRGKPETKFTPTDWGLVTKIFKSKVAKHLTASNPVDDMPVEKVRKLKARVEELEDELESHECSCEGCCDDELDRLGVCQEAITDVQTEMKELHRGLAFRGQTVDLKELVRLVAEWEATLQKALDYTN